MKDQRNKKSILESDNFEQDLQELRQIAEEIRRYSEQEEKEQWRNQPNWQNS
jgi:hypothetical protein